MAGAGYGRGLPPSAQFRAAKIGLLYLNLVPDFRPPGEEPEGEFPFDDRVAFGYPHCARGLRSALSLAQTAFPIRHVVTWSRPVWEALRGFTADIGARRLGLTEAAKRGGARGFPWPLDGHTLSIHPFPHTVPGRWHLNWDRYPGLFEAYREMWNGFLNGRVGP
jgi:hypothetical protein